MQEPRKKENRTQGESIEKYLINSKGKKRGFYSKS